MQSPTKGVLTAFAVLTILLTPTMAQADVLAFSDFTGGRDGWNVVGDAVALLPNHVPVGGNPGGYLNTIDSVNGDTWYWDAPLKFLGDKSAAFGGTLSFDLRMRGDGELFAESDVILNGPLLSLHAVTSPVPFNVPWTTYILGLDDTTNWRVGSRFGPQATAGQIQNVLSNLTSLRIRGEFISGSDNGDIDNVFLNGTGSSAAAPEPGTLALLGLAIPFVARRTRWSAR